VPNTDQSPELADAADVLSDQLRVHLQRLGSLLAARAPLLEERFAARLRRLGLDAKQQSAISSITIGAAARLLAAGHPALKFVEQVEYNGRRLAKLNLPPASILTALQEYDRLLTPVLRQASPAERANFQWVRDQLHFCVVLTLNNAYYQVRETETQAFYELFRVELESRSLDDMLRRFLATLAGVCGADAARLYMLNDAQTEWICRARTPPAGRGLPPVDARGRRRALMRPRCMRVAESHGAVLDASWKQRFHTCWSVPLAANGRTAGVMQFGFARPYEWLPREQELLAAAAERCLVAAEKARLLEDLARREEQIRKLAEHMLHVEEMERRRISRELHDEAGQSLLCIRLQMELLEGGLPDSAGEWKAKLKEARDLTEHTILEMRRLIAALSPAVLEQLGLGAALRQLVNRFRRVHPCRVRLNLSRIAGLPHNTEIIVYRLLQECFNNIGKHSSATRVNISVSFADGIVRLNVEDNGVGFDVQEALARRDSFGLSGMRERVALLGGRFAISSFPRAFQRERGTKISIELPVSRGDGAGKEPRREASRGRASQNG
jgi:signal transduction histidine kinase